MAAQERTTWSQYQGGPAHDGYAPDGPEPPFRVRWTLPAPAGASLSAAVVEGNVAIAVGDEAVYGVDIANGEVAWQIPRAGGPLSVPAVASDAAGRRVLVFVEGPAVAISGPASPSASPSPSETTSSPSASPSPAPGEENHSTVVAVRLRDRRELWRTPLEDVSRSGVTIEGGAVYVGDQGGKVYALSLDDGSLTWSEQVGGRADTSIAVADGHAYVVARDADTPRVIVAAFDAATGERAWSPLSLQVSSTAGSAPTVGGGSLFLGSADRRVRALDAANGDERWNALVLSVFSPATALAYDGRSVFAADVAGGLYRLDAADGARLWSFHVNETVLRSAPVVSGSYALLGLGNGGMVAVDVSSGHLVWRSPVTPGLIGSIALANDAAIAVKGGRDAGLIAFEHDPDGTLIDEPSPTQFEAGTSLSRWAIAAVLVFGIALALGLLARRRFGTPAGAASEEDADDAFDEDEPEDPFEDEDEDDDEASDGDEDREDR
ncbi:MAG TPA: PQQ-binding-like beta-propeller repeat protein [Actinomycetota bacterium]|nr:PQQ-binding-like beta-propeller repeat protein [Actinomycetota bacterium]